MLIAFLKSFSQVWEKQTRNTLYLCILLTTILLVILWSFSTYLLLEIKFLKVGWLEAVFDTLGIFTIIIITWLSLPIILSSIVSLFLNKIALDVERIHYPKLPTPIQPPFIQIIWSTVKFISILIILNLFILVISFLLPILFPFVFLIINGYLIGREYFELIASRRIPIKEISKLRKRQSTKLLITGVILTLFMSIPFINLIVPIVATSVMVHMFEKWRHL